MNIIYRTDIAFSIKKYNDWHKMAETLLEITNFSFLVFNSPGKVNHDSWAALKQCNELTLTENAPKISISSVASQWYQMSVWRACIVGILVQKVVHAIVIK